MTDPKEIARIRKSLTLAQRSTLAIVCAWDGCDRNGLPLDRSEPGSMKDMRRAQDMRTLFALCVRGLLAGSHDAVLRPTELGREVRE